MKLPLSTTCMLFGILGLLAGILLNLRNLKMKAKRANLIFDYKSALLEDWFVPALNFVLLLAAWILLPYRSGKWAEYSDMIVIIFFGVLGVMGSLLLNQGISSVKKRLDAATAFKVRENDKATGNTDAPTPAVKPPKP